MLSIVGGKIVTNDGSTLSFVDKNLSITDQEIRSGNVAITLNNSSASLSLTGSGIQSSSGLLIFPNSSAPSLAVSGYSVSGLGVSGLQPPAPEITGVSLGTTVSDQIKISFSLSPLNAGSPITHLIFKAYENGQYVGEQTTNTPLISPYEYNGLTVGKTYTFRVGASTSTRTSELSNESSSILVGIVPDAPANLSATISNDGKWSLVWDRPNSTGVFAVDYSKTQIQIFSLYETNYLQPSPTLIYGFPITDSPDLSLSDKARNGYGYTLPSIPIVYSIRDFNAQPVYGQLQPRTGVPATATEGTYGFSVRVYNIAGWSQWSTQATADFYPPPSTVTIESLTTVSGYPREYYMFVTLVGSTNYRFGNLMKFDVQIKRGFAADNNPITLYENYPIRMNGYAVQYDPPRVVYIVATPGFAGAGVPSMPLPSTSVIDVTVTNQYSMRIRASNPRGTSEWTPWKETQFF